MLVDRVDEGAVQVEQERRAVTHSASGERTQMKPWHSLLCITDELTTRACGIARSARQRSRLWAEILSSSVSCPPTRDILSAREGGRSSGTSSLAAEMPTLRSA